jgi:peptidoglycan hydrolase-like protein with peptidoglycan-binding domain
MRKLILATVSAVALGIAGAGPLYAADNNAAANPAPADTTATPTPSTGTMQPATPQASDTMQQTSPQAGASAQQTPSMSGNTQSNSPDLTSTSPSSGDMGRMSQADVRQMQQKLQQEGLYHGKIDGMVGPATQQALRTYQRKNALPVTGTPDQPTLSSLNGSGAGLGSSTPPATGGNIPPSSNAGASGSTGQPANPQQ